MNIYVFSFFMSLQIFKIIISFTEIELYPVGDGIEVYKIEIEILREEPIKKYFIPDTGSELMWMKNKSHWYTPITKIDTKEKSIRYSTGYIKGSYFQDNIYYKSDFILVNFSYIVGNEITNQYFNNVDGVIGFSIKSLFLNQIFSIPDRKYKEIVGFYIKKGLLHDKVLHIGGYSPKIVKNNEDLIQYCKTPMNSTKWVCNSKSLEYEQSPNKSIEIKIPILIDTGSSMTYIPFSLFRQMDFLNNEKRLCKIRELTNKDTASMIYCFCQEGNKNFNNKNIIFKTEEDVSIFITSTDYISNLGFINSNDYTNCYMNFMVTFEEEQSKQRIVIGNNVLQNYYTIFDLENARIGFYDVRENLFYKKQLTIYIICFIITLILLIIFFILFCKIRKLRRLMKKKATNLRGGSLLELSMKAGQIEMYNEEKFKNISSN
jgi:hypothetical protein